MEPKFKIGDKVNYMFGEGSPYKIVASKENPVQSNVIANCRPTPGFDYTIVSLKRGHEKGINPYLDVPKQHLSQTE